MAHDGRVQGVRGFGSQQRNTGLTGFIPTPRRLIILSWVEYGRNVPGLQLGFSRNAEHEKRSCACLGKAKVAWCVGSHGAVRGRKDNVRRGMVGQGPCEFW